VKNRKNGGRIFSHRELLCCSQLTKIVKNFVFYFENKNISK
jgi:hypothetical protein